MAQDPCLFSKGVPSSCPILNQLENSRMEKQFGTKPILSHHSSLIPLQEIVTIKPKNSKIGIVIHGHINIGDNSMLVTLCW